MFEAELHCKHIGDSDQAEIVEMYMHAKKALTQWQFVTCVKAFLARLKSGLLLNVSTGFFACFHDLPVLVSISETISDFYP